MFWNHTRQSGGLSFYYLFYNMKKENKQRDDNIQYAVDQAIIEEFNKPPLCISLANRSFSDIKMKKENNLIDNLNETLGSL